MGFDLRVWQTHQTTEACRKIKKRDQFIPRDSQWKPNSVDRWKALLSSSGSEAQSSFELLPPHVCLKCDMFPRQRHCVTKSPQELRKKKKPQSRRSSTEDMAPRGKKNPTAMCPGRADRTHSTPRVCERRFGIFIGWFNATQLGHLFFYFLFLLHLKYFAVWDDTKISPSNHSESVLKTRRRLSFTPVTSDSL